MAGWRTQYGIEGVDLDLEEGAGSRPEAGPNMVHFIRKLKELQPGFLVTQPTYGYPQAGPYMATPSSDRSRDRCDQRQLEGGGGQQWPGGQHRTHGVRGNTGVN